MVRRLTLPPTRPGLIWSELIVLVVTLLMLSYGSVFVSNAFTDHRRTNVLVSFSHAHNLTQEEQKELQDYIAQWLQQRPSLSHHPDALRSLCREWLNTGPPVETFDPLR